METGGFEVGLTSLTQRDSTMWCVVLTRDSIESDLVLPFLVAGSLLSIKVVQFLVQPNLSE